MNRRRGIKAVLIVVAAIAGAAVYVSLEIVAMHLLGELRGIIVTVAFSILIFIATVYYAFAKEQ